MTPEFHAGRLTRQPKRAAALVTIIWQRWRNCLGQELYSSTDSHNPKNNFSVPRQQTKHAKIEIYNETHYTTP